MTRLPTVRIRIALTLILAAQIIAPAASAQPEQPPLHASISIASDYFRDGLSQTDEATSARFALDFEHDSGFFAGGLLANVDYLAESQFQTPRHTQANVYAGYVWRRGDWMTNVAVSRYLYPDIERRYDYTQATVSVSFRDRYFLSVSRSNDFLSLYDRAVQYRSGIAIPWIWDLEVGINAGKFRSSGFVDTSYTFWDAGLSRALGRFALDLRFHDNTYDRTSLLGNYADDRWVFSLSYAILPFNRARANRQD
jgi:uncharacterized protein (TIGR02001 family)